MTDPRDPDFDPYKVLQIDPEADLEIIQLVYRRLARKYHPDVTPGPDAATRMLELNTAFEILGDAARRERFDRERAQREQVRRASVIRPSNSGPSGPARAPGGRPRAGAAPRAGPDLGPLVGGTPRPQTVSRDWTSGRSTVGGGYDPTRMRTADGDGAAGPPPGHPSGTVLDFGPLRGLVPARVRSPGPTSSTSNGSTGWRSDGPTATKSTGCSGRPVADAAPRSTTSAADCSAGARPALGPRGRAYRVRGQTDPASSHSARVCRILMLWRMPSPMAMLISEAPPWVMNGDGSGDRHHADDHPDVDDHLEDRHRGDAGRPGPGRTAPGNARRSARSAR